MFTPPRAEVNFGSFETRKCKHPGFLVLSQAPTEPQKDKHPSSRNVSSQQTQQASRNTSHPYWVVLEHVRKKTGLLVSREVVWSAAVSPPKPVWKAEESKKIRECLSLTTAREAVKNICASDTQASVREREWTVLSQRAHWGLCPAPCQSFNNLSKLSQPPREYPDWPIQDAVSCLSSTFLPQATHPLLLSLCRLLLPRFKAYIYIYESGYDTVEKFASHCSHVFDT